MGDDGLMSGPLVPRKGAQVALLASAGTPVMRPLWFDFAADEAASAVEDQFMFGPTYMVA